MTTMAKYHINAKGDAGKCSAVERCPFGGEDAHFSTAEAAREHYEAQQSLGVLTKLRQRKFLNKAVTVGAMTAVAFSLAGCSSISKDMPTPYNAPDEPVATDTYTPQPEATESDKLGELYEKGQKWVDENGSDIVDRANEWLKDNKPGDIGAPPSSDVDPAAIYWQGKNLTPTKAEVAEAQATLDSLVVTSESSPPYDRAEQFGRSFQTGIAGAVEHRDVPTATFKNDSAQARVVDGYFTDPYTGEQVHVIGGESYDADIDHIVPLKEAWDSGASTWTKDQRVAFANDMNNLVYVGSGINRSKSDKDAAEFLPSYEPAVCRYAVSQINIKGEYHLTVDSAERTALQEVISSRCTDAL